MAKIKDNALVSVKVASGNLTEAEGKLVTLGATGAALCADAEVPAAGVVTEGDDGSGDVGVAILGAYSGTVHFKAGGAVTEGSRLIQNADGTVQNGTAGIIVGVALESAVAGELFEGAPITPVDCE